MWIKSGNSSTSTISLLRKQGDLRKSHSGVSSWNITSDKKKQEVYLSAKFCSASLTDTAVLQAYSWKVWPKTYPF